MIKSKIGVFRQSKAILGKASASVCILEIYCTKILYSVKLFIIIKTDVGKKKGTSNRKCAFEMSRSCLWEFEG